MPFKDFMSDGGNKSRKLWLVIFTQLLVTGMSMVAIKYHMIEGMYTTLVGGLISLAALYITGNVTNKHVVGKQILQANAGVEPAPVAPAPKVVIKPVAKVEPKEEPLGDG